MASQEYATQKTSIDAQALINDAPISKYQWLIAIVCFFIVFVDGIDTAAMGFIAPALAQDWGIDRSQLGPVMSAALGGMIIGALVSGPTADRFGRKIVLSVSMLIFGGFTLASAYASDLNTLVVLRFLNGIGLGAAMPNATTLFSEYCPQRSRSLLVTCMFCGYNLGMATGGFISKSLANPTLLAILVLCAGVAINGAQSAMPALSARFYPTQCRATGVAWMSGIGRFGAVFGAWIGAVLLGNDWSFTAILSLLLIPATAAAVAIFVKSLVAHTDAT